MKFSAAVALTTLVDVASAGTISARDDLAAQPIKFANCGTSSDTAVIEKIILSPNPPQMGKPLNVKVTGELKKDIEPGSKVYLHVEASFIKKDFEFDACNTLGEYKDKLKGAKPLTCPIKAAKKTWEESILLPDINVPPLLGTVNIKAVMKNKDGSQVTCQNIAWALR